MNNRKRKLSLRRESLVNLDANVLVAVHGGAPDGPKPQSSDRVVCPDIGITPQLTKWR
jgi:hypothetical protein